MVKQISSLLAFSLLLLGCDANNDCSSGDSGLYLNVKTDASLNVIESDYVGSRATYDLSKIIEMPTASDFRITLYSIFSGITSVVNTWNSVDDYVNGSEFAPGDYRIVVEYGSITEGGVNKPYFLGAKEFEVEPDEATLVTVTASVQNSFISATVTDDFKAYFSDGNILITSDGRDALTYNPFLDAAPCFVTPGVYEVVWSGKRQGGNVEVTLFKELELHEATGYSINLDVDASSNEFLIYFNDGYVTIPIDVQASDIPGIEYPFIETTGFESSVPVVFSKSNPLQKVEYKVIADGMIKECKLTMSSVTATCLGCEEQLSLLASDVQALLKGKGLQMLGLDANRHKMAFVDFAGVLANMPNGNYEFAIEVADKYGRVTSPSILTVEIID